MLYFKDTEKCRQCNLPASSFIYFDARNQLEKLINVQYSRLISSLATQNCVRKNTIGDIVTGKAYKNYAQNPDENGILWISLCISSDGAPLRNQVY